MIPDTAKGLTSFRKGTPHNRRTGIARFCTAHRTEIASVCVLSLLLLLGIYLRLHNLANWFSYSNDYDEGAYILNARFIAEGLMPYRDFGLFHPPLYHLVLAGIFKLFGSGFMVARYFSVAVSLINVILVYAIARRTLGRLPAVVAGAIFALDPVLLYLGRRAVVEHLGLAFCLVGLLFLTFYLGNGRRRWIAASGVAFGLAISVKLLFLPLVAGVFLALVYLKAGGKWGWLARFGTTKALLEYLAAGAFIYAILVLLNVLGWYYPLPLFNSLEAAGARGAVVGFIVLFVPPAFVLMLNTGSSGWKGLVPGAWRAIRSAEIWVLAAATVLAFASVIGPFLLADPQATFHQIFGSLLERPTGEMPSYIGILFHTINSIPGMLKLYALPVLATLPVFYLLLRSRTATPIHYFVTIGLAVSLISLQTVFHLPRYYIAVWPFLALGAASLFKGRSGILKAGKIVALGAAILLLCSLSLRVTRVNQGYDTMAFFGGPEKEAAYGAVAELISTLKPHARVFCPSPMLDAVSPELEPSFHSCTFYRLFMAQEKASDIVDSLEEDGVDFIVLDPWIRGWKGSVSETQVAEFQAEVRSRSKLVQIIGSEDEERFEVYALTVK